MPHPDTPEDIRQAMIQARKKALEDAEKKERKKDRQGKRDSEALRSVKLNGYEPRCKACNFPGHEEHDQALLAGKISDSDYARIVGCTSPSIARHRSHVSEEIAQSAKAQAALTADSLFRSIQDEATAVRELREAARKNGDIKLALAAVDRMLRCVEVFAKIQGTIPLSPQQREEMMSPQQREKLIEELIEKRQWMKARGLAALPSFSELRARKVETTR